MVQTRHMKKKRKKRQREEQLPHLQPTVTEKVTGRGSARGMEWQCGKGIRLFETRKTLGTWCSLAALRREGGESPDKEEETG